MKAALAVFGLVKSRQIDAILARLEATGRLSLARAVAAIRPPLDALLQRGVSGRWLALRLAVWRVRHGLSALTLAPDGRIIARINPEAVVSDPVLVSLGEALEPVLVAAEAAFLRRYERSRDLDEMAGMMGVRRERGPHDMPRSAEVDDLLFLRQQVRAPAGTVTSNYRFGLTSAPGATLAVSGPFLPRDAAGNRQRAPRPRIMEGRPTLAGTVVLMGAASSYGAMEAAWAGGAPPVDALGPGHRALGVLERARGPGMLPAMDAARDLARAGLAGTGDITFGRLAPMRPTKASVAAEVGLGTRAAAPREAAAIAAAVRQRHAAVGAIFVEVRRTLAAQEPALATHAGRRLVPLARALDRWLQAQVAAAVDQRDARAATAGLVRALVVFLRSQREPAGGA